MTYALSWQGKISARKTAGPAVQGTDQRRLTQPKPGRRLFAAFVTRFAPFRYAANGDPACLAENPECARRFLETGVHDRPAQFAKAYYVHPNESLPLNEGCGLRTPYLVGVEGVAAGHEKG